MSEIDVHECHPISEKVEGERLYTNFRHNRVQSIKGSSNGKIIEQTQLEVDPEETVTSMYSDGSAHVEGCRGACTAIVNTKVKHFMVIRSLAQYRGKNSYRTELEGIYLGTKIAVLSESTDRE